MSHQDHNSLRRRRGAEISRLWREGNRQVELSTDRRFIRYVKPCGEVAVVDVLESLSCVCGTQDPDPPVFRSLAMAKAPEVMA